MSIEVLPFGTRCNIGCAYCYQESTRGGPASAVTYDKETLLAMLRRIDGHWILFGGEPLLVPLADLEEMLRIGFEMHGMTSVQTNGSLITPRHVELFARYNTSVGMSIDGPDELNDARWAGSLEATRKMTRRSLEAIDMLIAKARETGNRRLIPSFIICLHKLNLADDRWPRMKAWLRELDRNGVRSVQHHLLDLDYQASDLYVGPELTVQRLLELWDLQSEFAQLRMKEFTEVVDAQRGRTTQTCVWHACDPWNTRSVEGLNGNGTPTQCGRAGSNDGVDWVPAEGDGAPSVSRSSGFHGNRYHERQLSLYVTPQEHGGCKDCRFWMLCQGHCPGSAVPTARDAEGDWRLRTLYCDVFKALFAEAERRVLRIGEVPMSLHPDRQAMEARFYQLWAAGEESTAEFVLKERTGQLSTCVLTDAHVSAHGDLHGDHNDTTTATRRDA
jgi:uncharacterized protein